MLNDPEARALVAELEGRLVGYAELQDGIAEGKREVWADRYPVWPRSLRLTRRPRP